jgi:hypothetical protein
LEELYAYVGYGKNGWKNQKPWLGSELPCSDVDRLLFNSTITITLGDGAKARFWHHNWLEGKVPRYLAPNLFQLAPRKNRTIQYNMNYGIIIGYAR